MENINLLVIAMQVQELYAWVDQVPLSRPKRNFTRDFSDGGRRAPRFLF
jgi:hypothetical protein